MNSQRIADITTGHRRLAGTDWPVETVVYRRNARRWEVVHGLCNGVPDRTETFCTRREALAAAGCT